MFNNNVILVSHNGKEKIFIGKGIGFGIQSGQKISHSTKVEKVFSIDKEDHNRDFKQLIEIVDSSIIGLCEEIITMISNELKEDLNEKIHIALTDHIAFTIHRIKNKNDFSNPFLIEIQTLYKKEYEIASKAVSMLTERIKLNIPEDEIGFIALHIHSARTNDKVNNSIKYAFICNTVIEYIEDTLGKEISRTSLDYARFITHIRFAIQRIINNTHIKNDLLSLIKKKYKLSYKLAEAVAGIIEDELELNVPSDEVGFITLHIERLKEAI